MITQDHANHDIKQTKNYRKKLDALLQEIKDGYTDETRTEQSELQFPQRRSRERSIAVTKIQESIMWLGMDLKDMGTPNPYPNSKDSNNTIIEPTADGLKL